MCTLTYIALFSFKVLYAVLKLTVRKLAHDPKSPLKTSSKIRSARVKTEMLIKIAEKLFLKNIFGCHGADTVSVGIVFTYVTLKHTKRVLSVQMF